jgi:organic radical activating enzyme
LVYGSKNSIGGNVNFKTRRNIDRLALPITRRCNRDCPECPAKDNDSEDTTREELIWAGELIGPIGHIEVTGGEPTIHKDFEWFAENVHNIFQCNDILILTNGSMPKDKWPLLLKFDRVYITNYTDKFEKAHKCPSNTAQATELRDWLEANGMSVWLQDMDIHFQKSSKQRWANGCIFFYDEKDMVAYYKGQIYGCCTSWQLPYRGRGIVLTKDWRNDLKDIDLPCDNCFLGATVEGMPWN